MKRTAISWFVCLYFSLAAIPTSRAITMPQAAVRVVSYNVLSSHLASPSHFSRLNPEHLDAAVRLPKILAKLESEMRSSRATIFCLQEVSYQWAGKFHTFFANKGMLSTRHSATGALLSIHSPCVQCNQVPKSCRPATDLQ